MIKILKILAIFLSALTVSCSITSGTARTDSASNNPNQTQNNGLIDGKIKPFVDKTIRDETINVGIPIYKF